MAKVGKELREKKYKTLDLEHIKTIHKRGYIKDLKELKEKDKLLQNRMKLIAKSDREYNKNHEYNTLAKERSELILSFCKRYDIPYVYDDDYIMPFLGFGVVNLVHDENRPIEEWYKEKYLTFRINTFQDLDIIKLGLSEFINVINTFRKANMFRIPKKLHLRNLDRCLEVFKFRCKKPPTSFAQIVLKLKNYYKNKNIEQNIKLAKNDFRAIFEVIYGIPYKEYDKKEFRKANFYGCKDCNARTTCKEPCASLEYMLQLEEVPQQHYIGDKDVSEWNK